MIEFLGTAFAGFYIGGSLVTSIVVKTVDDEEATIGQKFFLAMLWPFVLYEASQEGEEI